MQFPLLSRQTKLQDEKAVFQVPVFTAALTDRTGKSQSFPGKT